MVLFCFNFLFFILSVWHFIFFLHIVCHFIVNKIEYIHNIKVILSLIEVTEWRSWFVCKADYSWFGCVKESKCPKPDKSWIVLSTNKTVFPSSSSLSYSFFVCSHCRMLYCTERLDSFLHLSFVKSRREKKKKSEFIYLNFMLRIRWHLECLIYKMYIVIENGNGWIGQKLKRYKTEETGNEKKSQRDKRENKEWIEMYEILRQYPV